MGVGAPLMNDVMPEISHPLSAWRENTLSQYLLAEGIW
jgi:hypothetical protein